MRNHIVLFCIQDDKTVVHRISPNLVYNNISNNNVCIMHVARSLNF